MAQYVPVIVYIVVVVDVPAGCTLIEYPSAAWEFTLPRTGAIGRWLRGAFEGFIKPLLRRLFPEESAKYDAL